MEIKLFIQHKSVTYDATGIVVGEVTLENSIVGRAGKLCFQILRDGIVNFMEGSKVIFFVNNKVRFSGWVMSKSRTGEQIISVTAYDQLFYLVKNRDTYLYWNKKASDVVRGIAADYKLTLGEVADTGWVIPQRIEEGQTLLDIILSALEVTKKSSGREYFFYDEGGKLTVRAREAMKLPFLLSCQGQISDYTYTTDIGKDTYNSVRLFQAERKQNQRLAYSAQREDKIREWGRLQYYQKVDHRLNQAQLKEIAENVLAEKCSVRKKLIVENINGGLELGAGNSIIIEIPQLAEINLKGQALIEQCVHRYSDGEHRVSLWIRMD